MRLKKVWAVCIMVLGVFAALNGLGVYQADSILRREAALADKGLPAADAASASATAIREEMLDPGKPSLSRDQVQRILFILLGALFSLIGILMLLESRKAMPQSLPAPCLKGMKARLYPGSMETTDDKFTL
jgi:hypothetical protein